MGCIKVIVRHLVGLLAFIIWLSGCLVIAVCLWIVTTGSHFQSLIDGKLTVTYFAIGLGGLLFLNGLLGWMGSSKRNKIMLKLFLVVSFLIILAEIGALVTISILDIPKSSQIINNTWEEMNPKSRSIIQEQLQCCGLNGPASNSAQPLDASCYHNNANNYSTDTTRFISNAGCEESLKNWFHESRYLILAISAGIFGFQIITMLLTSSAINYARKRHDSLEELDSGSHHHHHGATYM